MLTETEKQILGVMVDLGQLRGAERTSASGSDEIARELIAAFRDKMLQTLPEQIEQIDNQISQLNSVRSRDAEILSLLEGYS